MSLIETQNTRRIYFFREDGFNFEILILRCSDTAKGKYTVIVRLKSLVLRAVLVRNKGMEAISLYAFIHPGHIVGKKCSDAMKHGVKMIRRHTGNQEKAVGMS